MAEPARYQAICATDDSTRGFITAYYYVAVDRSIFWAAVDDALHGRCDDALPELGPLEHLIAAVVTIAKPRYVGERWPMLDPGDAWDDLLPIYQPSNLMPVEILLHALAGQLRLLGSVSGSTPGLLEILLDVSWDEAADLVLGDILSHRCSPVSPPGPESFEAELMILDRTTAASGRARISQAVRRYRDGDARFVAEVGGAAMGDDSPDNQLDEKIFADLAQLAGVYDVLIREEVEVLVIRNL